VNALAVCTAVDRAFLMPLAVMVKSLLASAHPETRIHLFLLTKDYSADDKRKLLESWPSGQLEVEWVAVDKRGMEALPVWGRMSLMTYQRLGLSRILPGSVRRVIWLDADLVVQRDLGELAGPATREGGLWAAQDMAIPYVSSPLGVTGYRSFGFSPRAPYFNSGVMVMDLPWWRENRIEERALDYMARHGARLQFWDQEALNVAIAGRWQALDVRWNVIESLMGLPGFEADGFGHAMRDPWVLHFAGAWKPWLFWSPRPARRRYFELLDQTAWAGWRPPGGFKAACRRHYESVWRPMIHPLERRYVQFVQSRSAAQCAAKSIRPGTPLSPSAPG
jgi:lipopolysaccharide biosynthesis glycosyltransferase